ncbi:MAG: UvrD-helicase domain-containing protein, partial [Thermodesulfobacteriota bacterium]
MTFIADLHIHSRFSRATARNLDLPLLDEWAGRKGLAVLGTGDVTHPGWLAEIEAQLDVAEEGLFRLKPDFVRHGQGETRFLLSGEISSIYKKDGRTRKVHNLILLPDLAAARKLADRLDTLGNIRSDGRPILGLDARDLLAICLDVSPDCFLIPAHIWTPWFSLLGSKSGFDSVEECFEDLTPHIHALETGLSSDPPMNWRLSFLDAYILVSNSDAHSPDKLGREANLFETDLSYPALVRALKGEGGFGGTLEFFPEEGKYHLDGHRKCARSLHPEETRRLGGLCPVCGRPVTVGVYSRVLELADRPAGERPDGACGYHSLIPLTEVLGEILGVGPRSRKVDLVYADLLRELGPELYVLREAPPADVARAGGELLRIAIERMREGRVIAEGGYDGEYGRIGIFQPGELETLAGQVELFPTAPAGRKIRGREKTADVPSAPGPARSEKSAPLLVFSDPLLDDLNEAQKKAVSHGRGPLIVVAGPGTGKTHVLTRRAAWLVREGLAAPDEILCITFTRQAAGEMAARLAGELPFRPSLRDATV